MSKIVQRGNTVYLAFTFKDENGDTAIVDSATCQVYYAGRDAFQTEAVTLTESGGVWSGTFDSANARAGWLEWDAYASAGSGTAEYAQHGKFKLTANNASYQRDILPAGGSLNDVLPEDYA